MISLEFISYSFRSEFRLGLIFQQENPLVKIYLTTVNAQTKRNSVGIVKDGKDLV